ncbi:dipeptide ABC transporter ATP-binding protein [Desulfopila inferna]|uniref:dipeptide ABC transporter ATP-binding protein n=1 Tax=Desulfopila inferna TaxID=468528 RepID=UPI0019630CA7|nr:dipeptide ABC transporter ATP-binding protein [Desulfopila inferna]MBM9605211.1 dipeptide ABC transporter ATP-binding protein [Desulfopila inferna]
MERKIVLQASNLQRHYEIKRGTFRKPAILKALDGATFTLETGRTLAVVGESGCGKSTLARLVTLIEEPTAGELKIQGVDIITASSSAKRALHSKVQIVFQDPYGSLNPRQKIGFCLEEPLLVNTSMGKKERGKKAREMLDLVGLRPEHYDRYPHMFSGGQRQRIAVARALMLNPEILVLDEPVSALDVSIQAQILNLITDLQDTFNLAYLFISHDLSVVKHIADDVMVMYLGRPIEFGSREMIFNKPHHPYTRALLSATPVADPFRTKERIALQGELPSPIAPPPGCTFHPRCPYMTEICTGEPPAIRELDNCEVACYHPKTY